MALPFDFLRGLWTHRDWTHDSDAAKPISQLSGLPARGTYIVDAVLRVGDAPILIGDHASQGFRVEAGSSIPFDLLDLDAVWVKNATAGANAHVCVVGYTGIRRP